jgi:hypothetical protein
MLGHCSRGLSFPHQLGERDILSGDLVGVALRA